MTGHLAVAEIVYLPSLGRACAVKTTGTLADQSVGARVRRRVAQTVSNLTSSHLFESLDPEEIKALMNRETNGLH